MSTHAKHEALWLRSGRLLALGRAPRMAQDKPAKGVITLAEVTIVGRIQKPIASVDVNRIQPKLTLQELRQPFLDKIEQAVSRIRSDRRAGALGRGHVSDPRDDLAVGATCAQPGAIARKFAAAVSIRPRRADVGARAHVRAWSASPRCATRCSARPGAGSTSSC